MQNGKPVLHASSVWNDYKRIYASTEEKLELVSLDYTNSVIIIMEDVAIETDHKLFKVISNKPLSKVPKRFKDDALDPELWLQNNLQKEQLIADTLSWAPVKVPVVV